MENWLDYFQNLFSPIDLDDTEIKVTTHYTFISFKKAGTYFNILLNSNKSKITKLEAGKYWKTTSNVFGYEYSSVKAVFNKNKNYHLDFLQTSFYGENGSKFELFFSIENFIILSEYLDVIMKVGWKEEYVKYKDDYYKINIELHINSSKLNYQVILMHFAEQDMPFPGDKIEKQVRAWWADLKRNRVHRTYETTYVLPFIKSK